MKKNDDQLLRQYKVQNLINIIEDLGERDLLQKKTILQMSQDMDQLRQEMTKMKEVIENRNNQDSMLGGSPRGDEPPPMLQEIVHKGEIKNMINQDLQKQIDFLKERLKLERQEKLITIGLNSKFQEEIKDLRYKIIILRTEQMEGINNEKRKYKDLQESKPPIRQMTVSLSKCSFENKYDMKGF